MQKVIVFKITRPTVLQSPLYDRDLLERLATNGGLLGEPNSDKFLYYAIELRRD